MSLRQTTSHFGRQLLVPVLREQGRPPGVALPRECACSMFLPRPRSLVSPSQAGYRSLSDADTGRDVWRDVRQHDANEHIPV
jgi:hypothetical protein